MKTSKIPKFYEKTLGERLEAIKEFAELSEEEMQALKKYGALDFETANRMIENVYSTFPLPLGIATNFVINGREVLVPFALEEPSVVAAASNAAKLSSGFEAKATAPIMIGQIQVVKIKSAQKAIKAVKKNEKELLGLANAGDSTLVKFGGGARKIEGKKIRTKKGGDSTLVKFGGGARKIEGKKIRTKKGGDSTLVKFGGGARKIEGKKIRTKKGGNGDIPSAG